VSVNLEKTSPSGFLRDFNFSALAKVVNTEVFGAVPQPNWLVLEVDGAMDPQMLSFVFAVIVKIEPHIRVLPTPVDLLGTGAPSAGRPKDKSRAHRYKRLRSEFGLPYSVIEQFRSETPKLFVEGYRGALLDRAYHLYEVDPRIGWSWSGGDGLLRCPLFDPPKDEEFSRTGLPFHDAGGELHTPSCAFCDRPHSTEDLPVWAGSNMMWVHRKCLKGFS